MYIPVHAGFWYIFAVYSPRYHQHTYITISIQTTQTHTTYLPFVKIPIMIQKRDHPFPLKYTNHSPPYTRMLTSHETNNKGTQRMRPCVRASLRTHGPAFLASPAQPHQHIEQTRRPPSCSCLEMPEEVATWLLMLQNGEKHGGIHHHLLSLMPLASSAYHSNMVCYQPTRFALHFTSPHLTSPHLTSPHITSHHITSHHITSHHAHTKEYPFPHPFPLLLFPLLHLLITYCRAAVQERPRIA